MCGLHGSRQPPVRLWLCGVLFTLRVGFVGKRDNANNKKPAILGALQAFEVSSLLYQPRSRSTAR